MSQLFFFDLEIRKRMNAGRRFAGNPLDFDSSASQGPTLIGIVRKEPDSINAETTQDRCRQTEISVIGGKPEDMIRFDRIETGVLQRISLQLGHQSYPTTLLMLINHQPSSFPGDCLHRQVQLIAAVAT